MKTFRPVEVETCSICGEQFDKINLRPIFTGRDKYICPACYAGANRQMDARRSAWRSSSRGKQVISQANKKK